MRRPLALLCWPVLAVGLAACGTPATSTSAFKGERHEVAQTIADLQSDATAGEEKKICADDLASRVVARLGGAAGCERAVKSQLGEVDNVEVGVQSVQLGAGRALHTASARVKSIHSGKSRESTVLLVKEDGKWKISGLG
jgi:hypothetical protein